MFTCHRTRMEVNLQDAVLSFHHMGPKDRTQVIRLGSQHLYQSLSYLDSPSSLYFLRLLTESNSLD